MKNILTLLLAFNLIKIIISGSVEEISLPSSKYNNLIYLNSYKIPISLMSFFANGDEQNSNKLINAFDGDFNTFWKSRGIQGEKYINIKTQKEYNPLINSITITFSKTVNINRMLYKAPYYNSLEGRGYPIKLSIYYKLKDINGELTGDEDDFLLFDEIISERTGNLVLFTFQETIECDQIKIEWNEIDSEYNNDNVFACEIMFLYPENDYLDKLIFDIFDKNDFTFLTLNKEYNNLIVIDDMIEELKEIYENSEYIQNMFKRIKSIINGEIKYQQKREFTTNQYAKNNIIYQRGNSVQYSKSILKMAYGGTDRQITGIYGFPNETINIFVECEDNDPLPSIRFSQFLGSHQNGWLGNAQRLQKGKNSFIVPSFSMNNFKFATNPGGPLYIENKFTSEDQSQKIKIYIEGGVLFPIFRKNDNETEYKSFLADYIIEYEKNIDKYLNITELYSDHIMISVEATKAYDIYINQNKSPQANLLKWDERIDKFFIFDGIQLEENQPYYDIKNKYINIHLRYSQQKANNVLAYATTEHIGLYMNYDLNDIIDSTEEISSTISHEIGHIIDVSSRVISEQTNNVIRQFSNYLNKPFEVYADFEIAGSIMYIDDINIFLRGCREKDTSKCNGLFNNYYSYKLGYVFWWFIEFLHLGYWGELDNLYRFNISLISGLSKTEGMIYLTSYVVNLDMGYYFERLGFGFENEKIFCYQNASEKYKQKMNELIRERNLDNSIKKKIWYYDVYQYFYLLNNVKACYDKKDKYDIQIVNVTKFKYKKDIRYNITFPTIDCDGHLGFEIYESDKLIYFEHKQYYIDSTQYEDNYIPKYKIIAYDRLLYQSNPSEYKEAQNNIETNMLKSKILSFLKFRN